jgi:hypothetical protein
MDVPRCATNATLIMDELFATSESLSPRKRWMAQKSISCNQTNDEWMCFREGTQTFAKGRTEEEACMELAIKLKTKSWKG